MGKNTGRGGRIGVVKNRRQAYNPRINKYVKIDTTTGKIIKTSKNPFKGVRMKRKKSESPPSPKRGTKRAVKKHNKAKRPPKKRALRKGAKTVIKKDMMD